MTTVEHAAIVSVEAAQKKLDDAKKAYHTAVCVAFPKGSIVEFWKGKSHITAEVLAISNSWWSSPRAMIRNINTGKEYWLDAWWLLRTDKPEWLEEA